MGVRYIKYIAATVIMVVVMNGSLCSQVVIIPEVQANGIVLKQQLWSVVINNLSGAAQKVILSVSVTDRMTSQRLMESNSNMFLINPGVKRVSYSDLTPLNYSFLSVGFTIDRQLNQPIPVGEYLVCYRLIDFDNKNLVLASECVKIIAEPLSPPQLIQPENNSVLKEIRPVLTWTPPAPIQMFNNLSYTIIVSPLFEKQSPEEALQRNIPVMTVNSVNNSILYPPSFTNLEQGKTYVWQVAAYDADRFAGKTEVWTFSIMPDSVKKIVTMAPYVSLSRQNNEVTVMHQGILKMEYFNSLADSQSTITVYKISGGNARGKQSVSFQLPVKPGQNFLEYDINKKMRRLDETGVYEVQLVNSKKEKWFMKFNPKYYF